MREVNMDNHEGDGDAHTRVILSAFKQKKKHRRQKCSQGRLPECLT